MALTQAQAEIALRLPAVLKELIETETNFSKYQLYMISIPATELARDPARYIPYEQAVRQLDVHRLALRVNAMGLLLTLLSPAPGPAPVPAPIPAPDPDPVSVWAAGPPTGIAAAKENHLCKLCRSKVASYLTQPCCHFGLCRRCSAAHGASYTQCLHRLEGGGTCGAAITGHVAIFG